MGKKTEEGAIGPTRPGAYMLLIWGYNCVPEKEVRRIIDGDWWRLVETIWGGEDRVEGDVVGQGRSKGKKERVLEHNGME